MSAKDTIGVMPCRSYCWRGNRGVQSLVRRDPQTTTHPTFLSLEEGEGWRVSFSTSRFSTVAHPSPPRVPGPWKSCQRQPVKLLEILQSPPRVQQS